MRIAYAVASAAALLLAGCVSTQEYNKVVEERDMYMRENQHAADLVKSLEREVKLGESKLADLKKQLQAVEEDRTAQVNRQKELSAELAAAKADAEKTSQLLTQAQEESKQLAEKNKELNNKVGELTVSLSKAKMDAEKAAAELQARIDKLTVELEDAKAQIEKLEQEAAELKAAPAPSREPDKNIAPKPGSPDDKAPLEPPAAPKLKGTKEGKVEK